MTRDEINFPIKPHELGAIAQQNGIAAGEPFPVVPDQSKGDGITTCLWHRCHEWSEKYYAPLMPLCLICGGRCDPREESHSLCFELKKRGLPTPQLDSFGKCNCEQCVNTLPVS